MLQKDIFQQSWVFQLLNTLQGDVVSRIHSQHYFGRNQSAPARGVHLHEQNIFPRFQSFSESCVFLIIFEYPLHEVKIALSVIFDKEDSGTAHAFFSPFLLSQLCNFRLVDGEAVYPLLENIHFEELPMFFVAE